jgi:hypothetical protein
VIGVLPDLVVSVLLGLGFCRWASAQAVHESVGVVPVHPRGGGVLDVGQRAQRPVAERGSVADAFGLVEPNGCLGQGVVEGVSPASISVSVKYVAVYCDPASL